MTQWEAQDLRLSWVAIRVARRGEPHPNPHVGALVADAGEIVGLGHHERAGHAHAEIVALRQAGARAQGATLYVTLEPCNHYGRTPPCVDAIVRAGIARVVALYPDPNPLVRGGGLSALRAQGVETVWGPGRAEVEALLAPWLESLPLAARTRTAETLRGDLSVWKS